MVNSPKKREIPSKPTSVDWLKHALTSNIHIATAFIFIGLGETLIPTNENTLEKALLTAI